ncbi:hypothetical protein N7495_009945 [Penicillium taxi]|uniref:uncharacterized protein n=1 Tax=Penicillium taxi TaxID=168475 RepID=UPI002545885D|nr:uncharacterized protein N7495_009945 [Penicillium taxi]KAJ5885435.1 hypothetical protein N7495_009945 [Penicillium taxi]
MRRTAPESPMDFEWQRSRPMDATSPFAQFATQQENKKTLKGTHTAFGSPEKNQLPYLRPPNSEAFLFSQPLPRPQPAKTPSYAAAFMTPRKLNDVDMSSGPENMSSPENADNDDTPEQLGKNERRNSLWPIYGRFGQSPGRGEIPRTKNYSDKVVRKIQKNRRRNQEIRQRIPVDSDDESDRPSSREGWKDKQGKQRKVSNPKPPQSRVSSFSEFFALLEAHPNVPNILSWWAQLLVNLSLFSLAVYIVFTIVAAIRAEFDQAAEEVSDTILAEMAVCAKSYVDNKCGGGDRLPALETVCENWERCMNRDPAKVGRAKVSAQTMATIINSFIDPISYKAVMIFLATISTVTVVSNWSFRSFRTRHNQPDYSQHHPNYPRQPPHESIHAPTQSNPSYGYYGQGDPRQAVKSSYVQQENNPLLLEEPRKLDFITERSRDREAHLRSPSPNKRDRRFM